MEKKEVKRNYKHQRRKLKDEYRQRKSAIRSQYLEELGASLDESDKPRPAEPPKRSVLEEIGNSVTHGVGAIFAIVAFILMCVASEGGREYVGAAIYFVGQFVMFTVSCLYHAFRHGSAVKRLFRRFDYSCIYLLIGATFAPILLCYSEAWYNILFLIIQWAIISFGITFIGVFGPNKLRIMHIPLYLLLGWCGVFFIPEMLARADYTLFGFILGGGVVYSLGIVPFALNKKAAHFIWHFFVLAGAVIQWVGIYINIYLK